jgi:hypothetical protein
MKLNYHINRAVKWWRHNFFFSFSHSDYFYHRMLVKLKAARKFGIIW